MSLALTMFSQGRPDRFNTDNTPDFTADGDAVYTQEDTTGGTSAHPRKIFLEKIRDSILVPARLEIKDSLDIIRTSLADSMTVVNDSLSDHWTAIETLQAASAGLDTIATVAALATYSRPSIAVYLQDHVKTYRGDSFTIKGGLLRRIPSGTTNNITIFDGSGGVKWQREIDGTTYYPEWCDVGISYSGVDIRSEAGRARAVIALGGTGATIVFQKGKTYGGQDIAIVKNPGQTWEGNGATLKCGSLIQTTLSSGYTAGGTVISVTDTTGFRVGQKIVLRIGIASDKHDATQPIITAVGASSITFTPTFTSSWGAGAFVTVVFDQVTMTATDKFEKGVIRNLIFDGNRTEQNATQSWLLNSTISTTSATSPKLEYCHFKQTRCENVILGTPKMYHCTADSCGGSFTHFNSSPANDNTRYGFLDHCEWSNMNLNNIDSAGHSEAAIIFSSNVYNISISNCKGIGRSQVAIFDDVNYFNGAITIKNNKFWKYAKILEATASDSTVVEGDIDITGNEFHSCGDIVFMSVYGSPEYDYRGGNIRRRIDIKDNNFINSKIIGGWVGLVGVEGNTFEHKVGYYSFEGWTAYPNTDSRYDAYINLQNFDRAIVSGNIFEGSETYNDTLDTAVKFILGYRFDDFVYNPDETDYYYPQSVLVSGNTMNNTRYGILTRHEELHSQNQVVNWFFTGNTITSRSDSIVGALIQVPPGAVATNNNLINISPHADYHALLVQGITDDTNNNYERLRGGEAMYNTINGQGSSIRVGSWTSLGVSSYYNALVMYNSYTGSLTDQTSGSSTVMFNIYKDSVLLPNLISPENPALHGFQEDIENY